ncbi:hypothetical protein LMH87_002285 [Akanthomyces muscarius]|uniref:Uncharacterized protein n=1 Tax=Akanthomyces muscarius TaxID=2231603 RepID=A0A9W8Q6I7_AKAMU|nr:hypothetical protein LMH87_002285 [Akanthomyces muscarius]KAJ4147779.1 hypothetical protein LMH87_002285 [Akanthomyces muscarius]
MLGGELSDAGTSLPQNFGCRLDGGENHPWREYIRTPRLPLLNHVKRRERICSTALSHTSMQKLPRTTGT